MAVSGTNPRKSDVTEEEQLRHISDVTEDLLQYKKFDVTEELLLRKKFLQIEVQAIFL